MTGLRLRALVAAMSGLFAMSGNASAADASTDANAANASDASTSTVVVTGIRASIESSVATKRNADSIVEVVTAEEIGKLPDVSIAESLSRLSGVAAQRVDGRAQALSIRGMAPKFGVTLLDGREMVSSGDDRSFEYDQFPSELIYSAAVYKTPDAALGTQGLSGTVNLKTVDPLDFKKRQINVNLRGEMNAFGNLVPGSDGTNGRASISYIDQFANNTIGVALGFSHLASQDQDKYFNPWDYGRNGDFDHVEGVDDGQFVYNGFETGVHSTRSVRDGLLGVLEFKPSRNFKSKLDVFHSEFEQHMNGRELTATLADWATGSTPSVTASGSTYEVTNISPILTMREDQRKDKIDAIGWNNEFKLDQWTLVADLSASRARRHEVTGEAYAVSADPIDMTVKFPNDLKSFGSVSSPYDFGNPANFLLGTAWTWGAPGDEGPGAYVATADVNDDIKSLRLSASRNLDWGPFSGLDSGVIYSDRTKSLDYVGTNYILSGDACAFGVCQDIPDSLLSSSVKLGFAGIPRLIGFNVSDAIHSGLYSADTSNAKDPSWNWGVEEKITTLFGKLDIDTELGIPLRGNLGLQVVHAKQNGTGISVDADGNPSSAEGGTSYTDVLPSLNLVGELAKGTLLRFGAARVVARPEMSDMRAGITTWFDTTAATNPWSGSAGNPELEPWRANAFDLSLEKYFGKRSYAAMALFKKKITTGIITQDVQYDFTGYTIPAAVSTWNDNWSNLGTLSTPENTHGGNISGIELSGSLEGALISPSLDGFGVLANYSHTTSNLPGTDAWGNPTTTSLEGLSGAVWNLAVYYEKNGFQARVAQRYRSRFTAARHNAFTYVMDSIEAERITDLQLGYTVQAGPAKGLEFLFQVNNLFNTPYVATQTVDGQTALKEYHEYGQQYLMGVSYQF